MPMPRQIISTFSNLAYVAVGICWWPAWPIAVPMILMGVASGVYHWTGRYWAQKADEISMYLVFWSLFWWHLTSNPWATLAVAGGLTGWMGYQHRAFDSYSAVPLLFFAFYALRLWQGDPGWFILWFVAGGILWMFGRVAPTSEDILHGAWHILTAIGFWMI